MSIATDEDVFTILTEDVEIVCDKPGHLCRDCPGEPAKYVFRKACKCKDEKDLLLGEFCKNAIINYKYDCHCTECGVTRPSLADFFDIIPL
jgi:hypothetical protein